MFNPLVDNLSDLTDNELESKISELSRKYFISHNPQVQLQISNILEMYKQEIYTRREKQKVQQYQQSQENGKSDLDNLIKVS